MLCYVWTWEYLGFLVLVAAVCAKVDYNLECDAGSRWYADWYGHVAPRCYLEKRNVRRGELIKVGKVQEWEPWSMRIDTGIGLNRL
jgi:hypothetical protein